MQYIALLDYLNLDQPLFMKSFAEAMSKQQGCKGIILHGDSHYTERLKKSGMDHNQSIIRSVKELNRRIVTLLADYGVPGIGINGYQKHIIQLDRGNLVVEKSWIENRLAETNLIISNLVYDTQNRSIIPVSLNKLAGHLRSELLLEYILIFVTDDNSYQTKVQHKSQKNLSYTADEIISLPENSYLCSITDFGKLPNMAGLLKLFV